MNTIEFLQISSAVVPDREALVEIGGDEKRVTYAEMYLQVVRLANSLQSLGIEQGEKVATMCVNSADFVLTYYACAMLGVTFVPLNYRAKDEELTHMLNVAECQAVFVSDRYLDLVERIRPTLTTVKNFISYGAAAEGYLNFSDLLEQGADEEIWTDVDDKDATIIIFTSGTTALPKGVQLTYLDMTAYVTNQQPADPEMHEKLLASAPFFHVAGATAMMLVDLVWPHARYPAAVHPGAVAARLSNRRDVHPRLRRAHDAQAHHGSAGLRQVRPFDAEADHLWRGADAVRGGAEGVRRVLATRASA